MRLLLSMSLVIAGIAIGGSATAQTRADLERCRAIADDARRLACYDAIDLSISLPLSKYEKLDLDEFRDDALSYRGDLVELSGWIRPEGELLQLGKDADDPRPIPIQYDSLSRRDRQAFLAACGEGCEATVQGRGSPVNFTTGVIADALVAR